MSSRSVLLNPGPVTLTERVRQAMLRDDWCHRESEFAELTQSIDARLASVYPSAESEFEAVMLTGSGTAALEAMLGGFAPDTTKTLDSDGAAIGFFTIGGRLYFCVRLFS